MMVGDEGLASWCLAAAVMVSWWRKPHSIGLGGEARGLMGEAWSSEKLGGYNSVGSLILVVSYRRFE